MLRRATLAMLVLGAAPAGAEGGVEPGSVRAWIAEDQVISVDLTPGRVIELDGIDALAEVLPPIVLEQFRFPGVEIEIQAPGDFAPHALYREATSAHAAQTSLAADGALEGYVAGRPFTDERIRLADPRSAGLMLAWNNIHRWDYYGYRTESVTNFYLVPSGLEANRDLPEFMSGGGRIERSIDSFFHRVYLNHLPMLSEQGYRVDVADSEKLLYKDYMEFTHPFDVAGVRMVVERSLDPHEEDQVQSYLPEERRVRRLSARERADGWMGTDYTLDDFEGFSGRVLDYAWSMLGEKSILTIADSRHDAPRYFGPMSNIPRDRWQLRDCYVVEARPIWAGHPYSARIMFVDKQTSLVRLTLVEDREERPWKVFFTLYDWPDADGERIPPQTVSRWRGSVAIDVLNGRSTVARGINTEHPVMKPAEIRRMFDASSLGGGR